MNSQKSFEKAATGRLYLVPTPIGNLDDMTFRAIQILGEVDLIACEDTRRSIKLLNHFELETPLISYHEHNKESRIPELTDRLLQGDDMALISDAGSPIISDPGYEWVQACLQHAIPVIPLAGANAAITALIASGLSPQPFSFYGFLPQQKNDRCQALESLKDKKESIILYESPHRLKKMLKDARQILGEERRIAIARELTKQYEEILRGTLAEAEEWASEQDIRGEFCLVIEGHSSASSPQEKTAGFISYAKHAHLLEEQEGLSPKEAIKEVAKLHQVPKRFVYNEYHDL